MNCIFCHNPLKEIEFSKYSHISTNSCEHCSIHNESYVIDTTFFIQTYNEPTECHDDRIISYSISFLPHLQNGFVIDYYYSSKSYIIYKTILFMDTHKIQEFNHITINYSLNITPQNFINKIYTIIAFS